MRIIISGNVQKGDHRIASSRISGCRSALEKYCIRFPPFMIGTLNVNLDKEFLLPDWGNVINISRNELHKADPSWAPESWKLLPIEAINGESIPAFILRPEKTSHYRDKKKVEIIGHEIPLEHEARIEITLCSELRHANCSC